jgi:DNA-binding NarL/FixJ family response regulator
MIHVLLVDDHYYIRRIIRRLLQRSPDIEVVDEAQSGTEAVKLAQALSPDVIVMDISMHDMNGFQAIQQIQALNIPTQIVILSIHNNLIYVRRALQQGARGYVLKRTAVKELTQAILSVWRGQTFVSPSLAAALTHSFS